MRWLLPWARRLFCSVLLFVMLGCGDKAPDTPGAALLLAGSDESGRVEYALYLVEDKNLHLRFYARQSTTRSLLSRSEPVFLLRFMPSNNASPKDLLEAVGSIGGRAAPEACVSIGYLPSAGVSAETVGNESWVYSTCEAS